MTKKLTLLILTVLLATSAAWGGTFLQTVETNGANLDFVLTNTGGGTGNSLTVTNSSILFAFAVPNLLGTGFRTGLLSMTASTSGSATGPDAGGNLTEQGWSGSGSIFDIATSTVAFTFTFGTPGTPTGSILVANAGTAGTFTDSRPPVSEVTFSSLYLNFSGSTAESFSFGLSGGTPAGAIGTGGRLANESFSGVGTFDAQPLPTGSPEPATMAMLGSALIGIGIIGRKRFAR
jgi:hypothetical protein